MPRVKSKPNLKLSDETPITNWQCPTHNLPIKHTCGFESCSSPLLCLICYKTHPQNHLSHTFSTPDGDSHLDLQTLYKSLGLTLKNGHFPIEDVFDKVQEHMQLVWKKLQETVKKKLDQELRNLDLWKQKLDIEKSKDQHEQMKKEGTLIQHVRNVNQFVQKWFLTDDSQAKNESQQLNKIFSEFVMKTEEIGNQICSIMQKSLADFCKEIKFENTSSLLSHLKTEQLLISNTYEFSISKKETPFFTETFDPKNFYTMLEIMNKRSEIDSNQFFGNFNSKFSTFSRQTINKSKRNTDHYSDQQSGLDPNIHFKRSKNPFIKNSISNSSNSKNGEIRQSLPATGQWEGHGQPMYYTDAVKGKTISSKRNFEKGNDIREHKSENISLIDCSQSKGIIRNVNSEFNNSFSHKYILN
jgi:hypothetical protein